MMNQLREIDPAAQPLRTNYSVYRAARRRLLVSRVSDRIISILLDATAKSKGPCDLGGKSSGNPRNLPSNSADRGRGASHLDFPSIAQSAAAEMPLWRVAAVTQSGERLSNENRDT